MGFLCRRRWRGRRVAYFYQNKSAQTEKPETVGQAQETCRRMAQVTTKRGVPSSPLRRDHPGDPIARDKVRSHGASNAGQKWKFNPTVNMCPLSSNCLFLKDTSFDSSCSIHRYR